MANTHSVSKITEWTLEACDSQIADTGDYDSHYELSNGKITLITRDEIEDEDHIALLELLNKIGARWEDWDKDNVNFGFELEKKNSEHWQTVAEELYKALKSGSARERALSIYENSLDCKF